MTEENFAAMANDSEQISERFRGFLPVVVDVETGGFNPQTDALLEIAASIIQMEPDGTLSYQPPISHKVLPFEEANIEPKAIEFLKYNPRENPLFLATAVTEATALNNIFKPIRAAVKAAGCNRAVLVGHNSWFDLHFLNAAAERCNIKRNPFHPFSSFDTATLGGFVYGQTVLARACKVAQISYDGKDAHTASYDTEKTAQLFCAMVNAWREKGGWPLTSNPIVS